MNDIIVLLILINTVTFVLFVIDKYLAVYQKRRISEKTLLLWSAIGGSVGAISAQKLFRHKTQKFKYVLWMILGVQIIFALLLSADGIGILHSLPFM